MKKIISILVMACMMTSCAGLKPDEIVKTDIPDTTINTVITSTGSWQSFIKQYWFAAAVSTVCIASLACNCWQYRKERGRVAGRIESQESIDIPPTELNQRELILSGLSQGSIDIPATVSIQEITADIDGLAADIERQTQETTRLARTYEESLAEIRDQFTAVQTRYTQEFELLIQQRLHREQHIQEITADRDRLAADIERQTQEITRLTRTYEERLAEIREPALEFTESQESIDIPPTELTQQAAIELQESIDIPATELTQKAAIESQGSILYIPATVSIQEITADRDRLAADIERQTQETTRLAGTYEERLAEIREQFTAEKTKYTQEFELLTQQRLHREQHIKEIEKRMRRLNNLLERTQQEYDRVRKLNKLQKEQIDELTADKEKAEKDFKELHDSCHSFMHAFELTSPVATSLEADKAELTKVIKRQTEEIKSRNKAIERLKRRLKEQRNQVMLKASTPPPPRRRSIS